MGIRLTNACSRRATRAADAKRYVEEPGPMRSYTRTLMWAITLLWLLPVPAYASSHECRFHLSIMGGGARTGFSRQSGHDGHHMKTKTTLGLLFAWPRNRASALEVGSILEGRGGSWFSVFAPDGRSGRDGGFERHLDLLYLILPIRVLAGLPRSAVTPSVHAGVEIAKLL